MSEVNEIPIKWWQLFEPIGGIESERPNKILIEKEVIPIIFVPGIMGSRLHNSKGRKVWDPDDKHFMLKNYGAWDVTAAMRKELLISSTFSSEYLEPLNDDTVHNNKKLRDPNDRTRDKRGWGGIYWESYGKFLTAIQEYDVAGRFGEPVRHCFDFAVHAFGYNWTDSAMSNGTKLIKYIEETLQHYRSTGRMCEQVILITHSMGGLVARAACRRLEGTSEDDKVLGIIHGAQPATGSPAAYWRMKAGFERSDGDAPGEYGTWLQDPLVWLKKTLLSGFTARTLGTDGEEVTSLVANMPGGLELLPTMDYRDNEGNKAWLKYPAADGSMVALPKHDPYEEIYMARNVFYRLVNPAWIDPDNETDDIYGVSSWDIYLEQLHKARALHEYIRGYSFKQCYQFYSEGISTFSFVKWIRHQPPDNLDEEPYSSLEQRGYYECLVDHMDHELPYPTSDSEFLVALTPAPMQTSRNGESGGDGTVPISSSTSTAALDSATINSTDENYLLRAHEPIMSCQTAIDISLNAIQNLSLLKIKQTIGKQD